MQEEITELQAKRGLIYGDFREHCKAVSRRMECTPENVGEFYINSKIVRWAKCPSEINRDSIVDLVSYIDLYLKAFGETDKVKKADYKFWSERLREFDNEQNL